MSDPDPEPFDIIDTLLNIPLYRRFRCTGQDVQALKQASIRFDCYCVGCRDRSTFTAGNAGGGFPLFDRTFYCARSARHRAIFVFLALDTAGVPSVNLIENYTVVKIGQHPSDSDIATGDLANYSDVLPDDKVHEFKQAIRLGASDAAIGAMTYLRRIVEHLVKEAHAAAQAQHDAAWETNYLKARSTADRIKLLRGHLADFLVDNASLYSTLSLGVHELSEEQCAEAFPVLRTAIELTLDEQLAEKKKQAKLAEGTRSLQKLQNKHSAPQKKP